MSSLLIVFLSIVLVVNAAFLMLLILIQLPKKEAGAGLAFGAGATDALFGAGSGNALTQMTKYVATAFLGLVLLLSFLSQRHAHAGSKDIDSLLKKSAAVAAPAAANSAAPAAILSNATKTATQTTTNAAAATLTTTPATAPTTTAPAATTPAPATPVK